MKTGRVYTQGGVKFKDGTIQLSASSLDNIPYDNPAYPELDTVRKALDHVLFFPLEVNLSGGSSFTKGREIDGNNITLNWNVNKEPIYQSLNQNIGILNNTTRTYNLSGFIFTQNTTFTLTVRSTKTNGDIEEDNNSTSIRFLDLRFWGTHPNSDITNSQLMTLNSELSTNRKQTRTLDGNGEYIYFAYPTYMGKASFIIGGFSTVLERKTMQVINDYNHIEDYYVYKTPHVQTGTDINIKVN